VLLLLDCPFSFSCILLSLAVDRALPLYPIADFFDNVDDFDADSVAVFMTL
jgi:hypothetical protein